MLKEAMCHINKRSSVVHSCSTAIYTVKPSLPPDSFMDSTQKYRKKYVQYYKMNELWYIAELL